MALGNMGERGVQSASDVLPFGRVWDGEPKDRSIAIKSEHYQKVRRCYRDVC
jgi:hypothetical protein